MRFMLIGAGFGQQHLAWLAGCEGADVLYIGYRLDGLRAAAAARHFGVPEITDDPYGVIANRQVDAVAVASSPDTHEGFVSAALDAGLHVVCEKPLAGDIVAARRIVDHAKRLGVPGAVVFQWRFNPALRRLREIANAGRLGPVLHADIDFQHDFLAGPRTDWGWRHRWATAGAGALADLGVHAFDLLRWTLPAPWSVVGSATSVAFPRREAAGGSIDCETEDIAEVLLESDRAQARVFVSRVSAGQQVLRVRLTGAESSAVAEVSAADSRGSVSITSAAGTGPCETFGPGEANPYSALLSSDPDGADLADGLAAQILLHDALGHRRAEPSRFAS